MSILAKNLKRIRKELGCTQSVLSGILKVGFRTFVRYEAGEGVLLSQCWSKLPAWEISR